MGKRGFGWVRGGWDGLWGVEMGWGRLGWVRRGGMGTKGLGWVSGGWDGSEGVEIGWRVGMGLGG